MKDFDLSTCVVVATVAVIIVLLLDNLGWL